MIIPQLCCLFKLFIAGEASGHREKIATLINLEIEGMQLDLEGIAPFASHLLICNDVRRMKTKIKEKYIRQAEDSIRNRIRGGAWVIETHTVCFYLSVYLCPLFCPN